MIQVSVIIPVFNTQQFLEQCIDSVLAAGKAVELEVILINDGSTDNSGMLCESYATQDRRVKVIHQNNRGVSAARNAGIEIAIGRYILFVDSDDWITSYSIYNLFEVAEKYSCDIVHGTMFIPDKIGNNDRKDYTVLSNSSGLDYLINSINAKAYDIVPVLKFIRLEYLKQRNIKFLENHYYEDHLFTLQLLDDQNSRLVKIDLPFYYYRNNPQSITNSYSYRKLRDICEIYQKMHLHFEERPVAQSNYEVTALKTLLAVTFYHVSSIFVRLPISTSKNVTSRFLKQISLRTASHGFRISIRIGLQNLLFKISPRTLHFVHVMFMKTKILKR